MSRVVKGWLSSTFNLWDFNARGQLLNICSISINVVGSRPVEVVLFRCTFIKIFIPQALAILNLLIKAISHCVPVGQVGSFDPKIAVHKRPSAIFDS